MLLLVPLHQLLLPLILGTASAPVQKRPLLRDRRCPSPSPCPRDPKTRQVVKTLVASTGYELVSSSTLHQVHDVTAQDDPEVIEEPDDDVDVGDDDIAYLGTSQPGELEAGSQHHSSPEVQEEEIHKAQN